MLNSLSVRFKCAKLTAESYNLEPDFDEDGIQIIFKLDEEYQYIIFPGSNEGKDWLTNLRFWSKHYNGNRYHGGYLKTLAPHVQKILYLAESRNPHDLPVIIAGHSAGGAWAVILAVLSGLTPDQVVTFGSPRAIKRADQSTQQFLNARLTNYKNAYDLVTRLPLGWRDYGKQRVKWERRRFKSEHPMQVYVDKFF